MLCFPDGALLHASRMALRGTVADRMALLTLDADFEVEEKKQQHAVCFQLLLPPHATVCSFTGAHFAPPPSPPHPPLPSRAFAENRRVWLASLSSPPRSVRAVVVVAPLSLDDAGRTLLELPFAVCRAELRLESSSPLRDASLLRPRKGDSLVKRENTVSIERSPSETPEDASFGLAIEQAAPFALRSWKDDEEEGTCVVSFGAQQQRSQQQPQEFVLLVDCSAAMADGILMPITRIAAEVLLHSLPQGCSFNVCRLGARPRFLFRRAAPYDEESLRSGCEFVRKMVATRDPEVVVNRALKEVLSEPLSIPGATRHVLLVLRAAPKDAAVAANTIAVFGERRVDATAKRSIDAGVCSFAATRETLVAQFTWGCKTCGLTGRKAVCARCAACCHAGHDLTAEPAFGHAFCDCGARGPSLCHCLSAPAAGNTLPAREPPVGYCARVSAIGLSTETCVSSASALSSAGHGGADFAINGVELVQKAVKWLSESMRSFQPSHRVDFAAATAASTVGMLHSAEPSLVGKAAALMEVEELELLGRAASKEVGDLCKRFGIHSSLWPLWCNDTSPAVLLPFGVGSDAPPRVPKPRGPRTRTPHLGRSVSPAPTTGAEPHRKRQRTTELEEEEEECSDTEADDCSKAFQREYTQLQSLLHVVSLQLFDGSWMPGMLLSRALGIKLSRMFEGISEDKFIAWSTAVAVAWLEHRLPQRKEEWCVVHRKALGFLRDDALLLQRAKAFVSSLPL